MQPPVHIPSTTLEPVASLTFPDADWISSVAFSPSGDTLYALLPGIEAVDLWGTVVHYWPEIGGGLVAFTMLLALVLTRRVLARPRRPGEFHCRRCNYCLTGCLAAMCPECGAVITPRTRVRSRPMRRRLLPILVPTVLLVVGYTGLWIGQVPRDGRACTWFDWYSVGLARYATAHDVAWLKACVVPVSRIDAVDTATGQIRGTLKSWKGYARGKTLIVSTNGESLYVVVAADRLEQISTRTGRTTARLETSVGTPLWNGSGWVELAGVSSDSGTVYATRMDEVARRVEVIAWTPATGRHLVVLHRDAEAYPNPRATNGGNMVLAPRFYLVPSRSPPMLVEVPHGFRSNYGEASTTVVHTVDGSDAYRTISAVVNSYGKPVFTPDGARMFRIGSSVIKGFELDSGESSGKLKLPESLSSDGPLGDGCVVVSSDGKRLYASMFGGRGGDRVVVRDLEHRVWLGSFAQPVGGAAGARWIFSGLRLSPDGQHLAVVEFRQAGSGRYVHRAVLFDLNRLEFPSPE